MNVDAGNHPMTIPATHVDVQSDEDHEAWPELDLNDAEIRAGENEASGPEKNGRATVDAKDMTEQQSERMMRSIGEVNSPSTSSSAYNSSEDEEFRSLSGDVFVKHRVRHKDTLASLAVRYNVSISDIKRANGYQNDSAMYGKEWVIIPKKPLPIDPEHAAWAGMILAHYEGGMGGVGSSGGIDVLGDREELRDLNLQTVSPRGARMTASLDNEERMMMRASTLQDRRSIGGLEVEMMRTTLGSSSNSRIPFDENFHTAQTDASQDIHDPKTREFFDSLREKDAANSTPQLFSAETTAKLHAWKERSSAIAMKELKNFQGRSIRLRDNIVNKLKRIGSQPAIGSSSGLSLNPGRSSGVSGHMRAASLGDGDGGGGLKKD